jgi:hypothetical protein
MVFIYLYETEVEKSLAIALSRVGRGLGGRDDGAMQLMYSINLIRIVIMNAPVSQVYPNKIYNKN